MMQMNSPFFRNRTQWGVPSSSHRPYNYKPPSKVVSIPVHFGGSTSNSRSDSEHARSHAAIKIQKLTRGFLVRKAMNKIASVRNEVEQIERRVSVPETVELMRRDAKERVRMSETIMNLLLRLDSVKALHSGVRDCRKFVINKAIALQEMLDDMTVPVEAISMDDSQGMKMEALPLHDLPETQPMPKHEDAPRSYPDHDEDDGVSVADSEGMKMEALEHTHNSLSMENDQHQTQPLLKQEEDPHPDTVGASVADSEGVQKEALKHTLHSSSVENGVKMEIETKDDGEAPHPKSEDVNANSQPISGLDAMPVSVGVSLADFEGGKMEALEHSPNSPSMEIEAKEDVNGEESVGTSLVEENEENNEVCQVEREEQERGVGEECNGEGKEERDGYRELLERMVEDNQRMMGLMAKLFEKNEMQTRLLSCLSHRVEQLERAFACEKLRRKKKVRRNADAGQKECEPRRCI